MVVVLYALASSSCAVFVSWEEVSRSWVGQPIEKFAKLNGQADSIVSLGGGETEHTYSLPKVGTGCVQRWQVDGRGIIVGYKSEGRCRPIG